MGTADVRDQLQATLGDAYRIERELPPGGMSRLFLATERSLNRPVVIKLMPPEYASEVSAARFQREVTLTAHLQHPHILPILAAGSRDGLLYYVMPYVEGESLRQRLERDGQLPVLASVQILREVADALARAHKAGIVHRDIKPENILLQDDHALLADFGVAQAQSEATGSERLTDTGTGLGTPGYMAPEQLAGGRTADARSDLYALAVVGYEMLAGTPPFTGPTPQAVAAAHFTSAPKPLNRIRSDVPHRVSAAIGKALAKEPDQRFASAEAFRDALTANLSDAHGHSVRRGLWVAGAVTLTAAVAIGIATFRGRSRGITDVPLLAVLPFENEGDSADAYFAEGMTDEVRSRLSALSGLQVIASTSSNAYRHSTKPAEQIGRELGVRYLLLGRVRWDKRGGPTSRVRVTPELVQVADVARPTSRWEHPFDADLRNVFQVQSDIAEQVVSALSVTLNSGDRRTLADRPTQDPRAYDAYLRAQAIDRGPRRADLPRAVAEYKRATALDPGFALAWAAMAIDHLRLHEAFVQSTALADSAAREIERAKTLSPELEEVYFAEAWYDDAVQNEPERALSILSRGLRQRPNDVLLLERTGVEEYSLHRWASALSHLQRAARLDPRNADAPETLGQIYLCLQRYPEAQVALDHALLLSPTPWTLTWRARLSLNQGDLPGARALLDAVPPGFDWTAFVTENFNDEWAWNDAQRRLLLTMRPADFAYDTADWGDALMLAYAHRGDDRRARAYADSALGPCEAQVREAPGVGSLRSECAILLAYLGRDADAVREAELAVALTGGDRAFRYAQEYYLGWVYVRVGQQDKAIKLLEGLLADTGWVSRGRLRLDPAYAPLRRNPRFERLMAEPVAGERPAA